MFATIPHGHFVVVVKLKPTVFHDPRDVVRALTGQGEWNYGVDEFPTLPELTPEAAVWCKKHLVALLDDAGRDEPICGAQWATPGWFNTGYGVCHEEGTPDDVVQEAYRKSQGTHKGPTKAGHYPCYSSVAFVASSHPSSILAEVDTRSRTMFEEHYLGLQVIRVIHEVEVDWTPSRTA